MKTFEIIIKVAGGTQGFTIKADNIMDALSNARKRIEEGLTDLSISYLEQVTIKEF